MKLLVVSSDRASELTLRRSAPPLGPGATPSWQAGQVTDFTHENLSGARFEDVYLTGADFHGVDLTGARFRLVDMTGVTIRGADLVDMDISGQIENLRINGIDVAPLVEAELDRRYPGRAKMRPSEFPCPPLPAGHPRRGMAAPPLRRTRP